MFSYLIKAFKYQTLSITLLAADLVAKSKPSILCKEQTDEGVAGVHALEIQISTFLFSFCVFSFQKKTILGCVSFPCRKLCMSLDHLALFWCHIKYEEPVLGEMLPSAPHLHLCCKELLTWRAEVCFWSRRGGACGISVICVTNSCCCKSYQYPLFSCRWESKR